MCHNSNRPAMQKIAKTFDISQFSKTYSIATGSISSVKVSTETCTLAEDNLIEVLIYLSLRRSFDSPKIPKSPNNLGLSRYWNPYFSVTTGLISFIKVSMENCSLVDEDSTGSSYIGYLPHNLDSPKVRNSAIDFNLLRYSNSYFNVTAGLISSIKVWTENPTLVKEYCVVENLNNL